MTYISVHNLFFYKGSQKTMGKMSRVMNLMTILVDTEAKIFNIASVEGFVTPVARLVIFDNMDIIVQDCFFPFIMVVRRSLRIII